jgi:hypothetical protein
MKAANEALLSNFADEHGKEPFDWIFAYSQAEHLLAETMLRLRQQYRIPTVNMCLDDKNSWEHPPIGPVVTGSRGLVAAFDLWWTSASVAVDWVNAEGGHGFYLPEGSLLSQFPQVEVPYRIPVSFVGAPYGRRPEMVRTLRNAGVPVFTSGSGWGGAPLSTSEMIEVFRKSQIVLGHGGIGYTHVITNVKGRDFEVTSAGGGAYLTSFNPDLAQHFVVGQEIFCWHSYNDLLEQVRLLLREPDRCRAVARAARQRCINEHSWLRRYITVLSRIGIQIVD